jgi:hypothetical protein
MMLFPIIFFFGWILPSTNKKINSFLKSTKTYLEILQWSGGSLISACPCSEKYHADYLLKDFVFINDEKKKKKFTTNLIRSEMKAKIICRNC